MLALAGAGALLAFRREASASTPEPPSGVEDGGGVGEPGSASGEPSGSSANPSGAPGPEPSPDEPPAQTPDPEPVPDPINQGQQEWLDDHMDDLPPGLQDINLSGNEDYEYRGTGDIGDRNFHMWKVRNSLNGLTIDIYVQSDNGRNYLSALEMPANVALGIPASLDFHQIHGETQVDRDWLSVNILNYPAGSFKKNVPDIAGRFF